MKKIMLIVACCLAMATAAMAQPHAIGVRVGQNAELSFQQEVNYGNMLQIDLGGYAYRGFQASVTYAWRSQVNGSSASGTWSSYGGFGIGGGYVPCGNNFDLAHYDVFMGKTNVWWSQNPDERIVNNNGLYDYGFFGILGIVGFEYELSSVPLSLAIDYRPLFGVDLGKNIRPSEHKKGIKFHTPGLWDVAFCVRYVF